MAQLLKKDESIHRMSLYHLFPMASKAANSSICRTGFVLLEVIFCLERLTVIFNNSQVGGTGAVMLWAGVFVMLSLDHTTRHLRVVIFTAEVPSNWIPAVTHMA